LGRGPEGKGRLQPLVKERAMKYNLMRPDLGIALIDLDRSES
jgi:hypothetical protein